MPRKPFYPCTEFPYNICARTNNRELFPLPMNQTWEIMCEYLAYLEFEYSVQIFSFVLMSNHFHMIARFPEGNISEAMGRFLRETSRRICKQSGRINHLWGTRFFRSRLTDNIYLMHAYKYNYRNPVDAGICKNVEDYPYSTLPSLIGRARLPFPMASDKWLGSPEEITATLKWLNTKPQNESLEAVRKALRRSDFRLARLRSNNKPHPLESSML